MLQDIHKNIGSRIRYFRKARGYTIVTFAQALHCSKSTVSKYERGEISIDIGTLVEIAEVLHIPLNMLIGNETMSPGPLFANTELGNGGAVRKLYGYTYCGHKQAYLARHVLLIGENAAYLYGEVDSEQNYLDYKYCYSGQLQRSDSFNRLLLVNPVLDNDIVILEYLTPLNHKTIFSGFFCTFSVGQYFPMSCKILLSENCITDEEWLKKELIMTKDDLKDYRFHNAFMVNFSSY